LIKVLILPSKFCIPPETPPKTMMAVEEFRIEQLADRGTVTVHAALAERENTAPPPWV
jgi:hypothetical protein